MDVTRYAIALGSNRRGRQGSPADAVRAALEAIGGVEAASAIVMSDAVGPSLRRYANAVAIIATHESPPALLRRLKGIERAFGRRRGQRWGARVIDLDIAAWSAGAWTSRGLIVPHPRLRERSFVLAPFASIAPDWRDPVSGRTIRQLHARLTARAPVPSRTRVGS